MNIKQRNIATSIILWFVTCGFYGIYWGYCVAKESLSVYDPEYKGTLECILSALALTSFIGTFMVEKKYTEGLAAKGIEHKDNSVMYLVISLFLPVVTYAMMQSELNKLAEA